MLFLFNSSISQDAPIGVLEGRAPELHHVRGRSWVLLTQLRAHLNRLLSPTHPNINIVLLYCIVLYYCPPPITLSINGLPHWSSTFVMIGPNNDNPEEEKGSKCLQRRCQKIVYRRCQSSIKEVLPALEMRHPVAGEDDCNTTSAASSSLFCQDTKYSESFTTVV